MIFYGMLLAIVSTIFGQFLRLEIGSGGILFLDFFLPFLTLFWAFQKKSISDIIYSCKKFPLFWEIFAVITVFSCSLFLAGSALSFREFGESGFYLFRYFFLLLFSLIVFDELSLDSQYLSAERKQNIFLLTIFFSGFALAVLGFLQLQFYPDFKEMAKIGWDPHIGRLLSTWFDPNFLGGLFSFLLVLLAGIFSFFLSRFSLSREKISLFFNSPLTFFQKKKYTPGLIISYSLFVGLVLTLLVALLFTFSRSALLTFVIPIFFLGIFYFRTIFILATIGILMVLPFSDRAMQRIGDGVQSALSITDAQPLFLPDATARLRVENFEEGITLATSTPENFITGVGFNTIRLHRVENIHSSGGFDSSLLTVLATTGIFGLIAFLWMYLQMFQKIFRSISYEKNIVKKGIQRGFIFSILGVFAQSFFINFLFFPLFMVFFFGILGYSLSGSPAEISEK